MYYAKGFRYRLRKLFVVTIALMKHELPDADESLLIAQRWCQKKGAGWSVSTGLGEGGTAPVFEVVSPDGPRALKIYNAELSTGDKGRIEQRRLEKVGHG